VQPLATLDDLESRYLGTIASADQPRVLSLLADASAVVRRYTRQQFTKAQTTERIRPVGYKLILPQRPVISVDSISVVDAYQQGQVLPIPLGAALWDGGQELWFGQTNTVINLPEEVLALWEYATPLIQVVYTHGYDQSPDIVIAVVCSMVLRAVDLPSASGMQSQSVGPFRYQLSATAQDGIMSLTASERESLDEFRTKVHTVELR
jgi:hypothetical protein